jgi:tRNA (cmo5U34)-methyltransferase
MNTRTEKHSFDEKRASGYDRKIRRLMPAYDSLHEMTNALLQSLLPDKARILVVGAGTGTDIVTCGRMNPAWSFTAIEPAQEMFELCRRNLSEAGLSERVAIHLGYLEDLPINFAFDAATSILVSHFIEKEADKLKYFSSIADRLKPGAPLVLADLFGTPAGGSFDIQLKAWKRFFSTAARDESEVEKSFGYIGRDISFIAESRLSEILRESGFGEIQAFFKTFLLGGWIAFK